MLLLALACTAPPEALPASTTTIRFEPGPGPLDFGDVPFPSDLYRDEQGRIRLGALPSSQDGTPLFDALRDLLAERGGFCTTCATTFLLDGDVDPDTVTPDAVRMVDVETGAEVPLDVQLFGGALTVRPSSGHVLPAGHRIAVAVTSAVHGADGLPLRAPPSLPGLDAVGLPPEEIAGLTVFTTSDPVAHLLDVRATVQDHGPGRPEVDQVWTGAALDDLLGVPAHEGAGIDLPPAPGTGGTRAVPHDTTALVVAGRFRAPRLVSGTGVEVGLLAGEVTEDEVPFVLIVPEGVDVTDLPVVLVHHGFNASRTTGFALADTAGRAGFAVLAIDGYQHGDRAASAVDERHALRDVDGPDGFAETSQLDVSARMFGVFGTEPGLVVHAGYPLAGFTQLAADAMAAVATLRDGDWSEVAAADPRLSGLAFDPDAVAYVGISMGSVVGMSVLVAEPDVRAGVLDVMPGAIVDTLAESGEFADLVHGLLLPAIGAGGPYDEVEASLLLDPVVDLYRWALEPVDPLALAPYLVAERRSGPAPDVLVQLAGHDEVAAPRPSEAVVSAAGLEGVGEFALAPVPEAVLPSSAVAVRFEGAMHGMIEVHAQTSTLAPPLVPPLQERDEPLGIDNPTEVVHAQVEAFLTSLLETGRAEIAE